MIEPEIVKQLRREEESGLLNSDKNYSNNNSKNELKKINEVELILQLQNGVIEKYLTKIKDGEIKADPNIVLTLHELKNYYNSYNWKELIEYISIDKLILSYYHLVNSYIENLENLLKNKELNNPVQENIPK